MIQIQNQRIMKNIPFDEYLKMPGVSYSAIKNEGVDKFMPTKRMELGTRVHNYLLDPKEYNYEDLELVKKIATRLKERIGNLIEYLLPELAVTCNFIYQDFNMLFKGRIDLGIPNRLVIDIKVSENSLSRTVNYFGYDKQLTGYSLAINARVALIININPKTLAITIYNVPFAKEWWQNEILKRGEPIIKKFTNL